MLDNWSNGGFVAAADTNRPLHYAASIGLQRAELSRTRPPGTDSAGTLIAPDAPSQLHVPGHHDGQTPAWRGWRTGWCPQTGPPGRPRQPPASTGGAVRGSNSGLAYLRLAAGSHWLQVHTGCRFTHWLQVHTGCRFTLAAGSHWLQVHTGCSQVHTGCRFTLAAARFTLAAGSQGPTWLHACQGPTYLQSRQSMWLPPERLAHHAVGHLRRRLQPHSRHWPSLAADMCCQTV
jgi:hypothetical protein